LALQGRNSDQHGSVRELLPINNYLFSLRRFESKLRQGEKVPVKALAYTMTEKLKVGPFLTFQPERSYTPEASNEQHLLH
jgi:hypothetical protein